MGEYSKKIGEIGENIVENFFTLIGWNNALSNQSLPCQKSSKHSNGNKTGKRETHGIDFLFAYKSPLESSTTEHVIVSVKHSNKPYSANPKAKFKEYVCDLAQSLECYKHSQLKNEQMKKGTNKHKGTGVLFWLSSSDDNEDDDLISKLSNAQIDSELQFDSFHVIDNSQVNFLYYSISFLQNSYQDRIIQFYYPETSLSYEDKNIERSNTILPVEFLSSPLIPLLLRKENTNDLDIFCFIIKDKFDKKHFAELIQASKEYTSQIKCEYLFLFPNYLAAKHGSDVQKIKMEMDLNHKIEVKNYLPDFRSLNNV